MPTQPQLAFAQAHAQARVAVHREVDFDALERELQALGAVVRLHSAAHDRPTYLQRPDLGRRLSEDSQALLQQQAADSPDVVFVIADGLSSLAIERNAQAFLQRLLPAIEKDWRVGPLVLVKNARVAVGDEVGAALDAALVVVLVGERPGLSSPDSMGIYLTWSPRVGLTDESRNCISNVRLEGMSYAQAVHKLRYLMEQARERQLSGVRLKDESDALITSQEAPARAFLVSAPPP
jgi:ethanolamine ammonia-lyase small subunit